VLSGVHQADAGQIYINGEAVHIRDAQDAAKHGVAIVHQELSIFPHLSVAENVLANRQPGKGGFVDKKQMNAAAAKWLSEIGVDIDVSQPAQGLTTSFQQLIEIARAISMEPKILIMDEPTSSLSDTEVEALFRVLRELRDRGIGIVYISHKINEILSLTDDIWVLRDGQNSGRLVTAESGENDIVKLMVGRDVHFPFPPKADPAPAEVLLEVRNLSCGEKVHDVSFAVEKGKILGLFGLMGAGRTESARTIFGLEGKYQGEIYMKGEKLNVKIPKDAMKAGIAYLPEDRKKDGLFLEKSVRDNVVAAVLDKVSEGGWVKDRKIGEMADEAIQRFQVKVSSPLQLVGSLSGGNQQKVLIGKYYEADPDVLIIDEPTRGIDVGAKSEIHKQLRELANAGHAVVVISSELLEVLGLSDKIVVMCEGRTTGELVGDEMNEENAMKLATKFS